MRWMNAWNSIKLNRCNWWLRSRIWWTPITYSIHIKFFLTLSLRSHKLMCKSWCFCTLSKSETMLKVFCYIVIIINCVMQWIRNTCNLPFSYYLLDWLSFREILYFIKPILKFLLVLLSTSCSVWPKVFAKAQTVM